MFYKYLNLSDLIFNHIKICIKVYYSTIICLKSVFLYKVI